MRQKFSAKYCEAETTSGADLITGVAKGANAGAEEDATNSTRTSSYSAFSAISLPVFLQACYRVCRSLRATVYALFTTVGTCTDYVEPSSIVQTRRKGRGGRWRRHENGRPNAGERVVGLVE